MPIKIATGFGADAERYDRARPRYPRAMIDAIVAASPGRSLLDVGCGTGIAARQFQAAGCTVLGVDVDARMAEAARGLEVEVSAFEAWDPAGRAFDAVVSGQTWHWIDPVAGAVKAAAALRPGGRLALFWNVFDLRGELADAFAAVYRRVLPDLPFEPWARPALEAYSPIVDKATAGIAGTGAFGEVERWRFDWEQVYTRDEWLDQVPSHGGVNQFPPERVSDLLDGLGAAIDAAGGRFTMPYGTVVLTARRG
jgi:SAM-dependent methyltransferase